MGMACNVPEVSQNSQAERTPWLGWKPAGRVCITIDADCLARLLANQQLHVQQFSCADEPSKQLVRGFLLDCLRTR